MFNEIISSWNQTVKNRFPYPSASHRNVWEGLPPDTKAQLLRTGETYIDTQFLPLKATDFLEYSRSGNRVSYEDIMFQKRQVLNHLVLAECVEYQGRFLDTIINGLFSICEETAWQLPAHNSYIRDTPALCLPDISRPVLDLFAAETGAVVAVAEYLLHDSLAFISPAIETLVKENLERRIFKPYRETHFWWMGDGRSHMNNWTAWCTQNVLLAAMASQQPEDRLTFMVSKAALSLDYFLEEYGEDGCCDEGAQYYRHAGLCLFQCMELLQLLTDGAIAPCFKEKKIYNIANYIYQVHVSGPYYVNFADCSPMAGYCNAREYLFGKRTNNPSLMKFAAADYVKDPEVLLPKEHNLFYRIQALFLAEEIHSYYKNAATVPTVLPPDIYYESAGVFITRDETYCLAVKSGDNDDSHNHNDTGSFTIYKNGRPLFIDVGVESYTKKTFSPQRYEIWTMQSQYHNLPTFQGVMQAPGAEYKANHVSVLCQDTYACISMDIASAYPDDRLCSYTRKAALHKGRNIVIEDCYEGTFQEVTLSLMTYEKPVLKKDRLLIGDLGSCHIEGFTQVRMEEIPITDKRLQTAWKHSIYRTLITFPSHVKLTIA